MGLSNLLTVKEVAAYLKTSRQQVRKMIQSGTLSPSRKNGHKNTGKNRMNL